MMGGWKLWTASGLMVGWAVLGLVLGLHDSNTAIKTSIEALALVGIGHKIEKSAPAASP